MISNSTQNTQETEQIAREEIRRRDAETFGQ